MRRQKRDMSSRAFDRGYHAGKTGRSSDSCPHSNEEQRVSWISGWREGREDYWNGFGAATKAQKLETYRTVTTENHHPNGWSTV